MASDVGLGRKLQFIAQSLEWRALRVRFGDCPICGRTLIVKLQRDQLGTRCVRCGGSPIAMAIAKVIRARVEDLARCRVYEASCRGPLFELLRREAGDFVSSELLDGVPAGEVQDGIRCEDLQSLSFDDASFDLCTSTEVLEHVPDDHRAFCELHRVLRPGGQLIFTVPLFDSESTLERAVIENGTVRHLEPPSHHDDLIRGRGQVLVFRDYGRDIVRRLLDAGFGEAEIVDAGDPSGMGHRSPVVVARRTTGIAPAPAR